MRVRVSGETVCGRRKARLTVAMLTPASRAIWRSVAGDFGLCFAVRDDFTDMRLTCSLARMMITAM